MAMLEPRDSDPASRQAGPWEGAGGLESPGAAEGAGPWAKYQEARLPCTQGLDGTGPPAWAPLTPSPHLKSSTPSSPS